MKQWHSGGQKHFTFTLHAEGDRERHDLIVQNCVSLTENNHEFKSSKTDEDAAVVDEGRHT